MAAHFRSLLDGVGGSVDAEVMAELRELAGRHDLVVEPGRSVIEVRSPGIHKGTAVTTLVEELGAGGFVFAGDDLGDLEALQGVVKFPVRIKCAVLGWSTLADALDHA